MSACALLVVGGGPAGHSAAVAYRAAGGAGRVVLLAGEGRAPYQRPPLSKDLLRGETEADALALADGPSLYDDHDVTVRFDRALGLRPGAREVGLPGGETIAYTNCVLATGAAPVRPPIPGTDLDGVHVLRTVADAMALRAAAEPGARALVLGSGFIGCEAAASLAARGCAVTLVSQEPAPQQARLGADVAERLAAWLRDDGIDARHDRELQGIERVDGLLRAHVAGDDAAIDVNLVLLADATLRTSAPGVLACGDACRAEHAVAGRPLHVEHWGDALAQGEAAGTTAAGGDGRWTTVPGFWSTIGTRTLKYAAWGDGYATTRLVDHGGGAFTAWYGDDAGRCVGVLAHDRDADYDAGLRLIEQGAPRP